MRISSEWPLTKGSLLSLPPPPAAAFLGLIECMPNDGTEEDGVHNGQERNGGERGKKKRWLLAALKERGGIQNKWDWNGGKL